MLDLRIRRLQVRILPSAPRGLDAVQCPGWRPCAGSLTRRVFAGRSDVLAGLLGVLIMPLPFRINGTLRGTGTRNDPPGGSFLASLSDSLLTLAALDHGPGTVPGDFLFGTQRHPLLNRRRQRWLLHLLDVAPKFTPEAANDQLELASRHSPPRPSGSATWPLQQIHSVQRQQHLPRSLPNHSHHSGRTGGAPVRPLPRRVATFGPVRVCRWDSRHPPGASPEPPDAPRVERPVGPKTSVFLVW
jgi:hypothetical protein